MKKSIYLLFFLVLIILYIFIPIIAINNVYSNIVPWYIIWVVFNHSVFGGIVGRCIFKWIDKNIK